MILYHVSLDGALEMCLKTDNSVSNDEQKRKSELCRMNKAVSFEGLKGKECVSVCVCVCVCVCVRASCWKPQ